VVQSRLSNLGHVVCTNGYPDQVSRAPQSSAAELTQILEAEGVPGPYLLVTGGDGVHTTRLFADGRDDIAGVVMVDPVPPGWDEFLTAMVAAAGEDLSGTPDSADLDPTISEALDFGDVPVVVIGQDPEAVFLSKNFVEAFDEGAQQANDFWQEGLAFYAGLSTESKTAVAEGSGMHMIIWDRPDIVVDEIMALLDRLD
jgi:pimeloyl-ACP methyl ester carboxylesterase